MSHPCSFFAPQVRKCTRRRFVLAVGTVLAVLHGLDARADANDAEAKSHQSSDKPRFGLMLAETVGVLVPPTIWYWSNTSLQTEDWDLNWNWPSWRKKLFSLETVRFDTNDFNINAIRHPLGGLFHYQVGRANGFGMLGSLAVDVTASAFWEYFVEFKELVSLNDLMVNASSGPSIGEPMYQLGRLRLDPDASWLRRAVAFVASPFEGLHELAGYRTFANEPLAWSRLVFEAGAGAVHFDDGTREVEGRLGFDLEIVGHSGYGKPGSGGQWTSPGQWSQLATELRINSENYKTFSGARIRTRTTVFGHYQREIDAHGQGWGRFLGAAAAFEYKTRRLPLEQDKQALFHILGPRLELATYIGDSVLTWDVTVYGDFAMMQAHVFGPELPFMPVTPPTSVLRGRGYYFGFGSSADMRLRLDTPKWMAAVAVDARYTWSIDGRDRTELGDGIDDPHDVDDQRASVRVVGGLDINEDVQLQIVGDGTVRRGTWQHQQRMTRELSAGLIVSLGF